MQQWAGGYFHLEVSMWGMGLISRLKLTNRVKKSTPSHAPRSLLTQLTQVKPIFTVFRHLLHLKEDVTLNMVCVQFQNPGLY